ncbi:zinc ribbon domain-containing protein [Halogeometricum sp. CBA1124]|uniref:zinc ribbon domain-containing protein n=1 Tax=Halogeometricum sp. CBA1124 TaxID=2668071 RepID=UPI00142B21B3|nr:zinc ribbon domain-containing protein [Halogeometricum sp. CBA1124]MUV59023.1 zinc ribbon domain-containing protein [Halogeometricum sp. CBA1124]
MGWEVTFRLLLTGFCIVAPTLLYVGLVRALERLRDDPFVERVLLQMDEEFESGRRGPRGTRRSVGSHPSSRPPESPADRGGESYRTPDGVCSRCSAPNPPYATFCDDCLARLSN